MDDTLEEKWDKYASRIPYCLPTLGFSVVHNVYSQPGSMEQQQPVTVEVKGKVGQYSASMVMFGPCGA